MTAERSGQFPPQEDAEQFYKELRTIVQGLSDSDLSRVKHEFRYGIFYNAVLFNDAFIMSKRLDGKPQSMADELATEAMRQLILIDRAPLHTYVSFEIMQRIKSEEDDFPSEGFVDVVRAVTSVDPRILSIVGPVKLDPDGQGKIAAAGDVISGYFIDRLFENVVDEQGINQVFLDRFVNSATQTSSV